MTTEIRVDLKQIELERCRFDQPYRYAVAQALVHRHAEDDALALYLGYLLGLLGGLQATHGDKAP